MKNYLLVLTLFLYSCNGDTSEETKTGDVLQVATEVSSNKADTLCFLKTAGATNQDTALIQLVINNDKVTGKMMNLPHEKDSRVGRINGVKDGDIITAKWTYMAEGMIDSVMVSYKLMGGNLLQKGSSFDPQTGKEFLPDTAIHRILFETTECGSVPMIGYDLNKIGL
jgi:hypothetical protein